MKVFRNDMCFVDLTDIVRKPTPVYLIIEHKVYTKDDFVVFTDPKCIEYIRGREDILDYDEVANLSNEEIDLKYLEARKKWNDHAKRMLETPIASQRKLYNDQNYMSKYKMYKYRTEDLALYRNNREEIDKKVERYIKNNQLRLVKKNREIN